MERPLWREEVGPAALVGEAELAALEEAVEAAVDFDTTVVYPLGNELGPELTAVERTGAVGPRAGRRATLAALADVGALTTAVALASLVPAGGRELPNAGHVVATFERLALCLPVLYAALAVSRQRLRRRLGTTLAQELRDVALPVAAGTLICMAGWQLLASSGVLSAPAENALLSTCALSAVCVALARSMSQAVFGRGGRRVVVVGSGVVAERVGSQLAVAGGVDVVGFVDDHPKDPTGWLGPLQSLSTVCQHYAVDHVVVAFTRATAEDVVEALRPLQGQIPISVVPRLFDVTPSTADAHDLVAGYPAVSVTPSAGGGWQQVAKRLIDIAGGTFGLVLSLPVLVVAGVGVRLSSRGPIFLRQVRVGLGGNEFTIWKFRTFTVTESVPPPEVLASGELVTGPFPKLKADPRATAFGRLLRRTSIDEIPQLMNVVLGTMSLVGPRPLAPDFAWEFERWALRRYTVKPGLTGLWQVSGRNDLTYEEMCRLDDLYSTCWSIGLDLRIVARTVRAVVSGRGCY